MLGSGTGKGSFIDGDIIFDEYGIPFFPGRRFKGLLRESAEEVIEMFAQCDLGNLFNDDILEIVFGTSTSSAGIFVDNLYLTDSQNTEYDSIVRWLRYIKEKYPQLVNKEAIIYALTYIRQQTAINTEGYAKENSLRTIRVLKPRKKFVGNIEILRKERQAEIEALLALACINLRRVGSGRNRGLGEVECSLYTNEGNNWNEKVIDKLKDYHCCEGVFTWGDNVTQNSDTFNSKKELFIQPTNEFAILPYRITSLSPLLFPSPNGDENIVNTFDYIPATALHGYYANQLIRETNLDPDKVHQDSIFRSWFLDGKLLFSNAYPVCQEKDRCLYPTPLFFYTDKEGEDLYNLLEDEFEEDADKTVGGYCTVINNKLHKKETEKIINFHLARNKQINDTNARIQGSVQEGGIFHYEAIKPGQEFHGYICGDKAELEFFLQLFGSKKDVRLGRSHNTQYGKAKIEFKKIEDSSYFNDKVFSLYNNEESEVVDLDEQVLLYLLSPLILTNNQGFYTTDESDLVRYLQVKLNVSEIKIKKRFAKVEKRQSFISHLQIYEPGVRYYTAGSSFLLEFHDTNGNKLRINEELKAKFNRLMIEGIGEKRHLGYGRVEFCTQFSRVDSYYSCNNRIENPKPKGLIPFLVNEILEEICRDNLQRIVAAAAAKRAKDYYSGNNIRLSSNLLGRLESICRNSRDAQDFSEKIKKLRDTAIRPLKGMGLHNKLLYDDLIQIDLEESCKQERKHWKVLRKMADHLKIENITPNYKTFWQVFFQTMRKLQKNERGRERNV